MSRQSGKATRKNTTDQLRADYKFDYSRAKPNRFAGRRTGKHVVVVLDEDIARVFKDPESVNTALRALISAMPQSRTGR